MVNAFPFIKLNNNHLREVGRDKLLCMFQNNRFNNNTKQRMLNDYGLMSADILMFVEAHIDLNFLERNGIELNGHDCIMVTGCRDASASCGQVCFARNNISHQIHFKCNNASLNRREYTGDLTNLTELSLFGVHSYSLNTPQRFILLVYKHPQRTWQAFWRDIAEFINKCGDANLLSDDDILYVIGDFNMDFLSNEYASLLELLTRRIDIKLASDFDNKDTFISIGRDVRSRVDWIFKSVDFDNREYIRQPNERVWLYETWYADHRPIAFEIIFD